MAYKRIGEKKVNEYYKKKGYSVYKLDPVKYRTKNQHNVRVQAGSPDFLIVKDKEKFYVEEKTDGQGLSLYQENVIDELIKSGERVILARYDSENKSLKFTELKQREILDEVKV